jgi:hypothetical protein
MRLLVNYNQLGGVNKTFVFWEKYDKRDDGFPPGFRISGSSRKIYLILRDNNKLEEARELLELHSAILIGELWDVKLVYSVYKNDFLKCVKEKILDLTNNLNLNEENMREIINMTFNFLTTHLQNLLKRN